MLFITTSLGRHQAKRKNKIKQAAHGILDIRVHYPDCSLADLYDELTMPVELRRAHLKNGKAVIETCGFRKNMSESEIVAELFKMYQQLTEYSKSDYEGGFYLGK